MMTADFETMKRSALDRLSVGDFFTASPPAVKDESRLQRPGESSAEASERWRREQAKLSEGHCRDLVRRLSAENAVRETTAITELRAVLRRYDLGGCDDVSYACRRLLKRIDRQ